MSKSFSPAAITRWKPSAGSPARGWPVSSRSHTLLCPWSRRFPPFWTTRAAGCRGLRRFRVPRRSGLLHHQRHRIRLTPVDRKPQFHFSPAGHGPRQLNIQLVEPRTILRSGVKNLRRLPCDRTLHRFERTAVAETRAVKGEVEIVLRSAEIQWQDLARGRIE